MSNSESLRCFLLNYTSRDIRNHFEIVLYAVTEDRTPVKIIINNFRPMFFVPRTTDPNLTIKAAERKVLPLKAIDGTEVDCLYFSTYSGFLETKDQLHKTGVILYESDINPVERFLMERFVAGGFEASGSISNHDGTLFLCNPVIRGTDVKPSLQVLSFDIETDTATGQIYSIACSGKTDAVFIIGKEEAAEPVIFCSNEKELIQRFFRHVSDQNPDILIGWNVINFDLQKILERCTHFNIPFDLGKDSGSRIIQNRPGTDLLVRIPGRIVMDVPTMLRANYFTFEEYSLNFVASEMLNKTKMIEKSGEDKIAEINRLFKEDKLALAQYNLEDARLTLEIFNKAGILPNAVERSKRSGHLLDRTGGSVAAFDHLYLPRLHRLGIVAANAADVPAPSGPLPGGYVLEPVPGIYENVLVLDFRSLYPSIILTFKIDPLGFHIKSKDRIKTPAGTSFSNETSILPEIIGQLLEARAKAKKDNNPYLSQAIKILMNSFYGVLGAQGCRFFSSELATTITRTGQYILKETINHIESITPYRVIYGDTDSLFVLLGPGKENKAIDIGETLSEQITSWLAVYLKSNFGVTSALHLEFETHFRHFLMPSVRGGTYGSKKHYCGSILENGEMKLIFKGMESARSDWTDLAKNFQNELIKRVFSGLPVHDYINDTVNRVKKGIFDNQLIYKKRLRKNLDEYTVNVPPHAQAARLLKTPSHIIRYYITTSGPQPLENLSSPIDYDHYIDCQLKPIADSILEFTGTCFDNIISGQLDLFGLG
jgi:DNA polymerase-2